MRRLPVYLVLDSSGSMLGEPIEAVRTGMQSLLSALRQDPYALESAWLSVITFSEAAQQVVPLTDLVQFQAPALTASGTTSMGQALKLLVERIDSEVVKSTAEQKGDWKPMVFLMTDGRATDDIEAAIAAVKAAKIGALVACAAGPNAETKDLQRITDSVVRLDTADSNSIKAFFKWVSSSIATTSQKVDMVKKEASGLGDLPPPPPEVNVVL